MDMRKFIALLTLLCFCVTGVCFPVARAQDMALPPPGQMLALSGAFQPAVLTGIKIFPDDPFRFDFIIDKGDAPATDTQVKTDSTRLIKYFLASLTVPEKDLWVNLSPYEKDRIVPEAFGQTEMGRDLLAQDYILKQITASVIYPDEKTGKEFWARVYAEARQRYGTTDIPVDTFNKVWIVPEKATVYEHKDAAYVVESRLKVMLESDYLAESHADQVQLVPSPLWGGRGRGGDVAKNILREVIIPILEKEVNEGKNFATLRQVYNSLILATWYKRKIKASIMGQAYVDQKKTVGIDIADKDEKEKIWQQYVAAFKEGAYNVIREEYDPATQATIPRKYFSGGIDWAMNGFATTHDAASLPQDKARLQVVEMSVKTADNGQGQQPLRIEDLEQVSEDPWTKADNVMRKFEAIPFLAPFYKQPASAGERYSLGERKRKVLVQFEKNFSSIYDSQTSALFRMILALSGLGQGEGGPDQRQSVRRIIQEFRDSGVLVLTDQQWSLLMAINNGDPVGPYMKGMSNVESTVRVLQRMSAMSGWTLKNFFMFLSVCYHVTSSSYALDNGGSSSRDGLYQLTEGPPGHVKVVDGYQRGLHFNTSLRPEFLRLIDAVWEETFRPVIRAETLLENGRLKQDAILRIRTLFHVLQEKNIFVHESEVPAHPDYTKIVEDSGFINDGKAYLYRGMRLTRKGLFKLLRNGLQVGLTPGRRMYFDIPSQALTYPFFPYEFSPHETRDFFMVMIEAERSSNPQVKESDRDLPSSIENIPPNKGLKIFLFDREKSKFVDITPWPTQDRLSYARALEQVLDTGLFGRVPFVRAAPGIIQDMLPQVPTADDLKTARAPGKIEDPDQAEVDASMMNGMDSPDKGRRLADRIEVVLLEKGPDPARYGEYTALLSAGSHVLNGYQRYKTREGYRNFLNPDGEAAGKALEDMIARVNVDGFTWSQGAFEALRTLLSRVPTVKDPHGELFIDVLEGFTPEQLRVLAVGADEGGFMVKITEGCRNQCAWCLYQKEKGPVVSMPFPILNKIMQKIDGYVKTRSIFSYLNTEPLDYYDPGVGATFADVVRIFVSFHYDNVYWYTHGLSDDLSAYASKIVKDTPLDAVTISWHMGDIPVVKLLTKKYHEGVHLEDAVAQGDVWWMPYLERYEALIKGAVDSNKTIILKGLMIDKRTEKTVSDEGGPLADFVLKGISLLTNKLKQKLELILDDQRRRGSSPVGKYKYRETSWYSKFTIDLVSFKGEGEKMLSDLGVPDHVIQKIQSDQMKIEAPTSMDPMGSSMAHVLYIGTDGALHIVSPENTFALRKIGEITADPLSKRFRRIVGFLRLADKLGDGKFVDIRDMPDGLRDEISGFLSKEQMAVFNVDRVGVGSFGPGSPGQSSYWEAVRVFLFTPALRALLTDGSDKGLEKIYDAVKNIQIPVKTKLEISLKKKLMWKLFHQYIWMPKRMDVLSLMVDIDVVSGGGQSVILQKALPLKYSVLPVQAFNAPPSILSGSPQEDLIAGTNIKKRDVTALQTTLEKDGIKAFRHVGIIRSSEEGVLLDVYEHTNGLKIIRKTIDQDFWDEGDMDTLKELVKAGRRPICPVVFSPSDDPDHYYELDLRDFGYQTLNALGPEWLTDGRRQQIMEAVRDGLRYDQRHWFDHGHLHGGNILIKLNEQRDIADIKIIDFSYLHKIDLEAHPFLKDIRDRKQSHFFAGVKVRNIHFEWMDLSGWDFSGADLQFNYFVGSRLAHAKFIGANVGESRFTFSDLQGADLTGADLYGVPFEGIDVSGVNFDQAKLMSFFTGDSLRKARNVNMAKNLRSARLWFPVTDDMTEGEVLKKIGWAADKAENTGGIDLDPAQLDLRTRGDGEGVRFTIDPVLLERVKNAPGVTPVIVGIQELDSLQQFLGIQP